FPRNRHALLVDLGRVAYQLAEDRVLRPLRGPLVRVARLLRRPPLPRQLSQRLDDVRVRDAGHLRCCYYAGECIEAAGRAVQVPVAEVRPRDGAGLQVPPPRHDAVGMVPDLYEPGGRVLPIAAESRLQRCVDGGLALLWRPVPE